MSQKQKTIRKPVSLKGKGLHTGYDVEITFRPAPVNHGYKFKRVDLEGHPTISASVDNVTDTSRGTTLVENGVEIHTIEHVLASLVGLELDNVIMEFSGPEAPILDGSARLYVEALKKAGFEEQEAEKNYYVIKERIVFRDEKNDIEIVAYPDDHFSVDVMVDYNSRVLGHQYASYHPTHDFEKEIAPSRTFVFFHELEMLLKHNLIKGGDLQNAIVIMENEVSQDELDRMADLFNKPHVKVKEGILNNVDLRFSNEPARHKLLDVLGDLSLIGQPVMGKIVASRPGHYANTQFAKIIKETIKKELSRVAIPRYDPAKEPLYDINQIKQLLPHRYPFLLIDKITELDEKSVIGIKNVTLNENFFMGHFPNEPIMPGVLQVEAMAQVGGILALSQVKDPENYQTLFLKIDKVKFKRKVIPGDTIIFRLELLTPIRRGLVHMFGQAFVGNDLVMEGELMAQVSKIN
ncbi:MAG: bifunctional UDP-3-O-[3-hydroxymyristoyl] N-acetylglucosamine deacetylase/3-hydroxyacyl-ACP dehydratase [Bacteroidales bacterium]|jgi:UDP-3-O-[3-hydroxymyristoyl] N-acetylglucosamine deacetylase/3-hydroxyacyl-[acyl-carrier-protein] dehydratase|nr:bifunctional UDP-3-O-[3-hydroxymyristoyl] N-acetylglucosamine deacetylase/3-hydroxyacyl-ACP dehydratase [Bacteroidales bacterium]